MDVTPGRRDKDKVQFETVEKWVDTLVVVILRHAVNADGDRSDANLLRQPLPGATHSLWDIMNREINASESRLRLSYLVHHVLTIVV